MNEEKLAAQIIGWMFYLTGLFALYNGDWLLALVMAIFGAGIERGSLHKKNLSDNWVEW